MLHQIIHTGCTSVQTVTVLGVEVTRGETVTFLLGFILCVILHLLYNIIFPLYCPVCGGYEYEDEDDIDAGDDDDFF